MESQWPKTSLADVKRLIKELNRGQEFTHQLREVILENGGTTTSMLAEDLVEKIMDSFCKTLSIINSSNSNELVSQLVPVAAAVLPCRKSREGSCETYSLKDERECNKKRNISRTSVKETSTLVDDGHVWRKYGQKQILDAPFPRSYYRCTHKFDQGCRATKQEQRIQANPPRFRTIYQGHHTCTPTNNYPTVSQILSHTYHEDSSSVLLNFNSNTCSPTFPSRKKEIKQDVSLISPFYYTINHNQEKSSSSDDSFIPSDDHLIEAGALSSGSDNGDHFISSGSVYSSCTSTHSTEMEMDMYMMADLVDFDEFINLL
ncbi:hypothetical protein HAX54_022614 [Datura stramonium]|uniref:WRKY domain-containing protein n=1 Tax=Datura stramonium TaxID=4076 RepID=A0ABS8S4H6_DATST|nr:hypothetical protein [Datura stramonium]